VVSELIGFSGASTKMPCEETARLASLRRHYPHQVQGVVHFALSLRQHSPTLGLIASLISAERFNTRKGRTSQPSGSPASFATLSQNQKVKSRN
jgi:hypothetical protein